MLDLGMAPHAFKGPVPTTARRDTPLGAQALKEMQARAADSEAMAARLHKEKRKADLMAEVWTLR